MATHNSHDNLNSYFHLLWEMSRAEFKIRDQGTFLGFLWTLLYPTLMLVVLYTLFVKWMGHFVDQYASYLAIGLLFWNHFQRSTSSALTSLSRRQSLIQNFKFPREIVIFSTLAAVLYSFLLELFVLFLFLMCMGTEPRLAWFLLPGIVLIAVLFSAGVSMFLPLLAAEYQDLERIWEVLTMAIFYLSPVFYPLSIISHGKRSLLLLNPIAQILIAARGCLIDGTLPNAVAIAATAAGSVALFAAGLFLLRRYEYHIMDRLMVQKA